MNTEGKLVTWKERVAQACNTGAFTQDDLEQAECFLTCAVGEVYKRQEKDVELRGAQMNALGMKFYNAVKIDDTEEAERVYNEIQTTEAL